MTDTRIITPAPTNISNQEQSNTDTFCDEDSDGDDVLNENVSDAIKFKAIEKTIKIICTYKTDLQYKTRPNSWFMHIISIIISIIDRVISPYKYKSENTRDAGRFNTRIL